MSGKAGKAMYASCGVKEGKKRKGKWSNGGILAYSVSHLIET